MYLKTLRLRGFKSFASTTTLEFEPGVTCVVGPNGSGKSNVVDALAWVMGEQGAKQLRGGKMDDVIFAGTKSRPPLGRAEVRLTIDNSDGALPIDYTEVTISRTLFRTGGSEYAINGTACRLLDIQDLLSDSGLGREMHVIVGQGKLDAILQATPEERRGFIEEAAGVLKHRKRKERAVRKLDSMQANLTRLQDLTHEIRRQLGPLAKQADVARRARTIQAEARDARARLLADDLAQATAQFDSGTADETALAERRDAVAHALDEARAQVTRLEAEAAAAAPRISQASEVWFRLSSLRERVRSTAALAAERLRLLGAAQPERAGVAPEDLDEQAERLRASVQELESEAAGARDQLAAATGAREAAEEASHAAEVRHAAALRAAADRREGLAKLAGSVATARSKVEARQAELDRLHARRSDVERAEESARLEFTALEGQIAGVEEGEEGLDAAHERTVEARDLASGHVERIEAARREAETDLARWQARRDTLQLSLTPKDGAAALLTADDGQAAGLLGSLAALLQVTPGQEAAIGAALGPLADAVAVTAPGPAVDAMRRLRDDDAGRAAFVIGTAGEDDDAETGPNSKNGKKGTARGEAPEGGTWALDAVTAPARLAAALRGPLGRTVIVPDLAAARRVVEHHPDLVAVTPAGELLAATHAEGGSAAAPGQIELQAALDEAEAEIQAAEAALERATFELKGAKAELEEAEAQVEETLAALHESDARYAAVAEKLGQLGAQAKSAKDELDRLDTSLTDGETALAEETEQLTALAAELDQARAEAGAAETADGDDGTATTGAGADPEATERDQLAAAAEQARAAETEARLALRTLEERARAMAGRVRAAESAAKSERAARAAAAEREAKRAAGSHVASAVQSGAERLERLVAAALVEAGEDRDRVEAERATREQDLAQARQTSDKARAELTELTDVAHRDEMARTAQRMRVDQLRERAVEELGIEPETLVREFGPDQPVPAVPHPWPEPAATDQPGEDTTGEATGQTEGPASGTPDETAATPPAAASETRPPASDTPASPEADAEQELASPYVRAEQEKRLRKAERSLALLGRVNPLALEEYQALEERHRYLAEQLQDLKKSRQDCLEVIREIDGRVEQIFADALRDTAAAFEQSFARLFPGGEGRLVATEPDNMLTTGVDIEARPAGKSVKRLSLLSGGERSLVAVAFVVAIFMARPSPFYVMDEVEAALDETNLGRLLDIIGELREHSQILMITHQKRTMEVADALYGVTMRDDGVTQVISQRLKEEE